MAAAARSRRWEHTAEHHPQRSSQGKEGAASEASWQSFFAGESLLKLPPAFSGEASESAAAPQELA